MATKMVDAGKNFIDDDEDLSLDEWDGLLITEWFQADVGALVPASSRFGEFKYAHENPAAWSYVDMTVAGTSELDAIARMRAEARHMPGKHDQSTHGKGGTKTAGVALSNRKADDLAARAQVADGGFTVDPRTGKDVKEGYAVAIYPERSKEIPHAQVDRKVVQDYVKSNEDILSQSGNMMGGWHDPDSGNVWLDVSRVTNDRTEAINLAKQYNQIAIFDLGSGNSINTGGTGRSSYPFVFGQGSQNRHLPGKHNQKDHAGGKKARLDAEQQERLKANPPPNDITDKVNAQMMDHNSEGNPFFGNPAEGGQPDWGDPRDHRLMAVAGLQGHDGKPVKGDVDAAIKNGGVEVHRGIVPFDGSRNAKAQTADELDKKFKEGDYEPGTGNYGSGYYFSTSAGIAKMYADAPIAAKGYNAKSKPGGKTVRAAMKPDAKIIEYGDLNKLHDEWFKARKDNFDWDVVVNDFKVQPGKLSPELGALARNPGTFAAMMGYDGIRVPLKDRSTDKMNKARITKKIGSSDLGDEIVVVNRGALIVGED